MILKNKIALFSLFEIAFSLLLILGFLVYGFYGINETLTGSSVELKTYIHSYSFSDSQREIIFKENFSEEFVTEDWNELTTEFSNTLVDYSLYVGNGSFEKIVALCDTPYVSRSSSMRLLFNDENPQGYRTIRLEVCA